MTQSFLNFPPFSSEFLSRGSFFQMFKVSPTPVPSMKVRINAGHFWLNNNTFVDYEGGTSPTFRTPNNNAYWGLLTINPSNRRSTITYGVASSNPMPPECPDEHIPLAWVYLESDTTRLSTRHVFDARPFFTTTGGTGTGGDIDAEDIIEQGEIGTGLPLFEFTGDGKARFYSIAAGSSNVSIVKDGDELKIDIAADIGFDDVVLLDMGFFT